MKPQRLYIKQAGLLPKHAEEVTAPDHPQEQAIIIIIDPLPKIKKEEQK